MVASADIKVKKILKLEAGCLYSPVFTMCDWGIGKVKHTKLGEPGVEYDDCSKFPVPSYYFILSGFCSCKHINRVGDRWMSYYDGCSNMLFGAGIDEVLCDAVIPKGSSYYLNERGEYISDGLVIVGAVSSFL